MRSGVISADGADESAPWRPRSRPLLRFRRSSSRGTTTGFVRSKRRTLWLERGGRLMRTCTCMISHARARARATIARGSLGYYDHTAKRGQGRVGTMRWRPTCTFQWACRAGDSTLARRVDVGRATTGCRLISKARLGSLGIAPREGFGKGWGVASMAARSRSPWRMWISR